MHQQQGKKAEVRSMFNNIAPHYDFLNHFLSLGIDIRWRKKLVKLMKQQNPSRILDAATGTADLAIAASKIADVTIIGIDVSEQMLEIGETKIKDKRLQDKIKLMSGDSEALDFNDQEFDAVMVAFGVRNFENLNKGLKEFYRVLKPGGIAYILEFSQPQGMIFKSLFGLYFKRILPLLGRIISKDINAYTYLPESVDKFPYGEDFQKILTEAGVWKTRLISLTNGVASIYLGYK